MYARGSFEFPGLMPLTGFLELGEPAFQLLFAKIGRDATDPIPAVVVAALPDQS